MINIFKLRNGLNIIPRSDGATAPTVQGDLAVSSVDGKLYYNDGSVVSQFITASDTALLQNKQLEAQTTSIVDSGDPTKRLLFQTSGATTGTSTTIAAAQTANRVITLPDSSGTLVVSSGGGGIIAGNLLDESSVWFVDHSDNTKSIKFNSSGNSTGRSLTFSSFATANRVITLPDASDQLVGLDTTDTLTNKTLSSPILNGATADTITGIAGGALSLQSDTNQSLILQSNGSGPVQIISGGATSITSGSNISFTAGATGNISLVISGGQVINIDNMQMFANTLRGANTADLNISAQGAHNLNLNSAQLIKNNAAVEFTKNLNIDRADDSSTTGTLATLSSFTTSYVKVTNASLVSLAGIPAGANGEMLIISNGTGVAFSIVDEDGGTTAANRIRTGTAGNLVININASLSLIYDSGASRWKVYGGAGGLSSVGTFDSQSASANGLVIANNTLYAQSADATHPGMLNNVAQVIAGEKTFNNAEVLKEIATPSNPSSGFLKVYPKNDDNLYALNSAGQEIVFNTIPVLKNEIEVYTGNGFGSSGTTTRCFSNSLISFGSTITYTADTTNGDFFTVNENGIYSISYSDAAIIGTNSAAAIGITRNSSSTSTSILSLAAAQRVQIGNTIGTNGNNGYGNVSATLNLVAGDIIRAQTDGTALGGGSTDAHVKFIISKVGVSSAGFPGGMTGTDWKNDLTFTFGGVSGSTAVDVRYKRVGDSMQVRGSYNVGTVSGTNFSVILPVGFTIDSTKLQTAANSQRVGISERTLAASSYASTSVGPYPIFYDGSDTSQVFISIASSTSQYNKGGASSAVASGENFSFDFEIPITGWNTNNGPGASGFQFYASSQVTTNLVGAGFTSFTTFSGSPAFTFTPIVTGKYKVYGGIPAQSTAGAGGVSAAVRIFNTSGGATLLNESQGAAFDTSGATSHSSFTQSIYLLTSGVSYVFDIQGQISSGTVFVRGDFAAFYLFAELCG